MDHIQEIDYTNKKSLSYRFRAKRMKFFFDWVRDSFKADNIKILDVGGYISLWETFLPRDLSNLDITVLNLPGIEMRPSRLTNVHVTYGDATHMPEFENQSFDIAFSNSVIEHVGMFRDRANMAKELKRIAKYIFIQTPNRYFPIEPHHGIYFPYYHLLPFDWQSMMYCRRYQCPEDYARLQCDSIRLLSKKEFLLLFMSGVGGTLYKERLCGLVKSYTIYGKVKC